MNSVTRSYHSPAREKKAEETRKQILDAALGLLGEDDQELSLNAVAKAAGVAERTLFRHFATKEELLDAVWQQFNVELALDQFPASEEELLEKLPRNFAILDKYQPLVYGYLFSKQGRELRRRANPKRRLEIRQCLVKSTEGLSAREAERLSAIVGLLISVPAWNVLRERNEMTSAQAAQAVSWAVRTLIQAAQKESV